MTHPRPAAFLPSVQAASVCTVTTSGGTRTRGLSRVGDGGFSVDLLRLHSLAILIARDRVSSGDAEKPSKRNLFLAFHKLHKTHGNKALDVIPAGGRHRKVQRDVQLAAKSSNPLQSTSVTKGARFQTLWAKRHWKRRWLINLELPHLLQRGSTTIFFCNSFSPTGSAPLNSFHEKVFSLGPSPNPRHFSSN